jgi:GNAT superfamily N-acetyltransferase
MLTYQLESVDRCWNQVMELAVVHWAGTKSYRRHYPFNPSFERYREANQQGFFQLLTARDGERLAGYFGVYLSPSMHSQHVMMTEDTFFLHPDYRGGTTALRFLKHILEQARAWGVQEIMFSCEADNDTGIQRLLTRLDFEPVIMQYSLRLTQVPPADSGISQPKEEPADVRPQPTS